VAPVGILYRSDRVGDLVAREASIPTHGGPLAIAGAAAVAAAVSAIDGRPALKILELAEQAAAGGGSTERDEEHRGRGAQSGRI
jgi:ADP-ribosylglycohydrolase